MSTSDDIDLDEVHRFASHLAILAGVYLGDQALQRASRQSGAHYDLELTIKENAADLVTKADKHAEEMISTAILQKYPQHKSVFLSSAPTQLLSLFDRWGRQPWTGSTSLPAPLTSFGKEAAGNGTSAPEPSSSTKQEDESSLANALQGSKSKVTSPKLIWDQGSTSQSDRAPRPRKRRRRRRRIA